jgi:hypothetical protein
LLVAIPINSIGFCTARFGCSRQNPHIYLLTYAQLCKKIIVSPMAPHDIECIGLWGVVSVMWWWCVNSEFMGQDYQLSNQTELWGRKHIPTPRCDAIFVWYHTLWSKSWFSYGAIFALQDLYYYCVLGTRHKQPIWEGTHLSMTFIMKSSYSLIHNIHITMFLIKIMWMTSHPFNPIPPFLFIMIKCTIIICLTCLSWRIDLV